jgi:hypothetical protein
MRVFLISIFFVLLIQINSSRAMDTAQATNNPLSIVPYAQITSPEKIEGISVFEQLFSKTSFLKQLKHTIRALKQKSKLGESITDNEIQTIQKLWQLSKLSCNYDWMDSIINPSNYSYLSFLKKRKNLLFLVHPDKAESTNNTQFTQISKIILELSRPERPTDSLVINVTAFALNHLTPLFDGLISKACSNIFQSNNLHQCEKLIARKHNDIGMCNNAIKIIEKRTHRKYELAQEALTKLSRQYRSSKAN